MTEPAPPPPPAKKGLSTGAKIAIGCLVAVCLVAGGCFVVTMFVGKKVVDFAKEAERDPEAAAVKATALMMKMNPDVEVVSSDPEAGTITLREKRTGKVVTFNAEDLKRGKFSFEAEGEKFSIDADASKSGEPGAIRIESGKEKMVLGADVESIPGWIPAYPGGRAESFSSLESNGERSGTFTLHTSDAVDNVLAHFERELRGAGFEVEKSTMNSPTARGGNLTARSGGRTLNITLFTQEGETQGLVAYSEKL
ncbi:MAG TPA: hypothetical protein VI942_13610 [Thermoanaerobaculia bacterium]|nr:hypothetical protein [Thermoanaerobaculia bacterium]